MRNSERSTFAAERLVKTTCDWDKNAKSATQFETTLHVVDSIAVGLECRVIAKLERPDVGIVWMSHVPANASFADASLQIRNVVGLLKFLQFS